MKLNLQRSPLYVYMLFSDYDGFKIMPVFEDMDETDFKYNVNSKKKLITFSVYLEKPRLNIKNVKKSFYSEYFML